MKSVKFNEKNVYVKTVIDRKEGMLCKDIVGKSLMYKGEKIGSVMDACRMGNKIELMCMFTKKRYKESIEKGIIKHSIGVE